MSGTNPQRMTYEEIVAEIRTIHGGITRSSGRMAELCKVLLDRARADGRRASADPIAALHVVYASAWIRVAGLMQQAIRRTENTDRMLDEGHRSLAEEKKREEEVAARRAVTERREKQARQATERGEARTQALHNFGETAIGSRAQSQAAMDDLIGLYGKEMIDASR